MLYKYFISINRVSRFFFLVAIVVATAVLQGCNDGSNPRNYTVAAAENSSEKSSDWPAFLGGPESAQYSPLEEINRENVSAITQVWQFEFPNNGQSYGNPLVIGGRMYVPWSGGIIALDARTGEVLWSHDAPDTRMRGLSSWQGEEGAARRLFFHHNDRLYALDADNGRVIHSFGNNGSIDLKQHLDRDPKTISRIESQSPGRVYENLIIVGSTGGFDWDSPPGYIRAYNVVSGELEWTFHSIPQPGEPNTGTWPEDAWKTMGGVNSWSTMTIDEKSGTLFIPFASPNYDFYGVNRPGDNLYGTSLVAVDALTGRYLWHFQTVHHDLWDYDLPQAPKLLTLEQNGEQIEAVAVAGKTGFVYTFERRTGKPVFAIEERPVPISDIEGEQVSPTQPFPTAPPPFARQSFSVDDLSPYLDDVEREQLTVMIRGLRNEGLFTPPSRAGSIAMPGTSGGTNWGNGVVDPRSGRYFVVSHEVPSILKLTEPGSQPVANFLTADISDGEIIYQQRCAACHGDTRRGQPPVIPSLLNVDERLTIEASKTMIERGRATMPSFKLAAEDMNALLEYLGYDVVANRGVDTNQQFKVDSSNAVESPIKYKSGYNFLFSRLGIPANSTPWATLTAYDMNNGTLLWQVPYGELPGLKDSGTIFPKGAIVGTGSGLLIAANQDRMLRVWDMENGQVLHTLPLPAMPGGVPAVYAVDGRQYIAVPAASYDPEIAKMTSSEVMPEGRNSLVVFALPSRTNP